MIGFHTRSPDFVSHIYALSISHTPCQNAIYQKAARFDIKHVRANLSHDSPS